MKFKDFFWILVIVSVLMLVCGAVIGVMIRDKVLYAQSKKELEQTQIYPTGSFTLKFWVNEDVMDLEAKEATTILVEQFVMALAEAESSYRYDGNIEHIKLLGARIMGDKETEARLKNFLIGRPSTSD